MAKRTENRREFLMLAHVFDPVKHGAAGWYMSEKLDGMRAYWDGGITRGLYAHEIPFANTAKDHIRVNAPKSTGLWSRYAKPIQAPMWFLDKLPKYPLDGELYLGPQRFEELVSTVRKLVPDDAAWAKVTYRAFDLPDYSAVFAEGNISNPQMTKEIKGVVEWLHMQKVCKWTMADAKRRRFETVVFLLNREHPPDGDGLVRMVAQEQLPFKTAEALARIEARLEEVVNGGGEGLVLRNLAHTWEPQRSWSVLKVKPFEDCEVRVRGYIWGRETGKGSKLLGLMGAMITDFKGKRLELSGFTDAERRMTYVGVGGPADAFGETAPGEEVDVTAIANPKFPVGSTVTIRYRELTAAGVPKEARYWRPRPEGA